MSLLTIFSRNGKSNDWKALLLDHPFGMSRDTALYPPLRRAKGVPSSLKWLAKKHLGIDIQTGGGDGGGHDPLEDARTAMGLYRSHQAPWEEYLKARSSSKARRQKQPKK
jgi:RNA exonuclease 4